MIHPMLVVDKDVEVYRREQAEWRRHGISTVRVDTMQERPLALCRLAGKCVSGSHTFKKV